MDRYFKDFFWTFVLCAVGLSAFFVAQIANAVIGGIIAPAPEALLREGNKPTRSIALGTTSPLADFLRRNIFHAEREDLDPAPPPPTLAAAAGKAPASEFNENECEPSALSVQVFAVFAAEPQADSVVILKAGSDDEFSSYRPGDSIEGASIREIGWRSIKLDHNGQCELVSLDQPPPSKHKRKSSRPPPPSGPASKIGATVKKTGKNEYTIPRGEIDNVLSNLNQVATQARIVPSFKNGKSNGFKLFAIKRNSLYSKIGVKNGDVVQRINGYELDSPDKALQIYSKLKDASNISVDLIRRGKTMSLNYNIR